jgi:hypothetical protein
MGARWEVVPGWAGVGLLLGVAVGIEVVVGIEVLGGDVAVEVGVAGVLVTVDVLATWAFVGATPTGMPVGIKTAVNTIRVRADSNGVDRLTASPSFLIGHPDPFQPK